MKPNRQRAARQRGGQSEQAVLEQQGSANCGAGTVRSAGLDGSAGGDQVKLNRANEPVVLSDMRPLSVARLMRGQRKGEGWRILGQLLLAIAGWVFIYAWLS